MKNYIGILIIVFCALFTNCTTEEQTKENNPPQKFEISIISGEDFATLNWTESIDPDGDKVTYNLYVDDKLVEANFLSVSGRGLISNISIGPVHPFLSILFNFNYTD